MPLAREEVSKLRVICIQGRADADLAPFTASKLASFL
jgi:hypothetical protein